MSTTTAITINKTNIGFSKTKREEEIKKFKTSGIMSKELFEYITTAPRLSDDNVWSGRGTSPVNRWINTVQEIAPDVYLKFFDGNFSIDDATLYAASSALLMAFRKYFNPFITQQSPQKSGEEVRAQVLMDSDITDDILQKYSDFFHQKYSDFNVSSKNSAAADQPPVKLHNESGYKKHCYYCNKLFIAIHDDYYCRDCGSGSLNR